MTPADLVAEVEQLLPCVSGLHGAHCDAGEAYWLFEWRGDDLDQMLKDMRSAIVDHARPWLNNRSAVLYWRYAAPRIFWFPDDQPKVPMGRLVTRLAITDRPIVWKSWDEYDAARRLELERTILGAKPDG